MKDLNEADTSFSKEHILFLFLAMRLKEIDTPTSKAKFPVFPNLNSRSSCLTGCYVSVSGLFRQPKSVLHCCFSWYGLHLLGRGKRTTSSTFKEESLSEMKGDPS